MSNSNPDKIISLNITKFPQNLLIPDGENLAKFQMINHSNRNEIFKVIFQGENLEVHSIPPNLKEGIKFNAGESKTIDLTLNPTVDGFGKLNVVIYWMKESEIKIKVQKVKERVATSKIKEIHNKYALNLTFSPESFNISDYIGSLTSEEIQNEEVEPMDLDKILELVEKMPESDKKQELITNLALEQASINPELACKIVQIHKDTKVKRDLLVDVIIRSISIDQKVALKLSKLINDDILKTKVLFNIAKKLIEKKEQLESIKIFNQIIDNILKSSQLDLSTNNYNNSAYEMLKDGVCCLAEVDCPKTADSLIEGLNVQKLKEKVTLDLFDLIYEMIEEVKKKFEPQMVYSQYFLFNTLISNITDSIISFSLNGGNVSSNILIKDFTFNILFISLFNFEFSVFPILDRVYADLKVNLENSIGYYIYPLKDFLDEKELKVISETSEIFIKQNISDSHQINIYNLDFIPYLGKPTIIISTEPNTFEIIKVKIEKELENSANIVFDDVIFKEGTITESIKRFFPTNNFTVINLVLSYEFINNYEIFKSFMKSLIK